MLSVVQSLKPGCLPGVASKVTRGVRSTSSPVGRSLMFRHTPAQGMRQPKRHFTTTLVARKDAPESQPPASLYTFSQIQELTHSPDPKRILVDVREPAELVATGKIPGAHNLPITTAADGFFLPAEEFEERFGWEKPGADQEVIFYCKAGVRSRAAARLAAQAGFGGKIGEYPGSWSDWAAGGGEVERVK